MALLRNIGTDKEEAIHRTALELWPQSAVSDRLVVGEGIETTLSAALHANDGGSR
jgi:hypothetical protein